MRVPEEAMEHVEAYVLYWIESINNFAYFTGRRWHRYDNGKFISLTEEDISILRSCLGL